MFAWRGAMELAIGRVDIDPLDSERLVFVITWPTYNLDSLLRNIFTPLPIARPNSYHRTRQTYNTPLSSHERQDSDADTLHRPEAGNVRAAAIYLAPPRELTIEQLWSAEKGHRFPAASLQ